MNRGAVAIIDALGFRGIWGSPSSPSTKVLTTLKTIGAAAREDVAEASERLKRHSLPDAVTKLLKNPSVKVVQLSDTIVVAAGRQPRQRRPWQKHISLWHEQLGFTTDQLEDAIDAWMRYLVCRCVCAIQKTAALCDPALVYRGVVTVGSFTIDENFILGPAVDEAAELMDIADGPYVWLTPSAARLKHVIRQKPEDRWDDMCIRYSVPFRDGKTLGATVLDPFAFCDPGERQRAKRNALQRMASNRIDIAVKRQNAVKLYEAAERRLRNKKLLAERKAKKQ